MTRHLLPAPGRGNCWVPILQTGLRGSGPRSHSAAPAGRVEDPKLRPSLFHTPDAPGPLATHRWLCRRCRATRRPTVPGTRPGVRRLDSLPITRNRLLPLGSAVGGRERRSERPRAPGPHGCAQRSPAPRGPIGMRLSHSGAERKPRVGGAPACSPPLPSAPQTHALRASVRRARTWV